MCVVALALDAHPRWRLVLAGNRDEFHARPSAALARWDDAPGVIAGRDLVSGGSWCGVSTAARVAVVTNVRSLNAPDPALRTRGELVSAWLADGVAPEAGSLGEYNPFSLCLIDGSGATRHTNRPSPETRLLASGLHSLSNGEGDMPWPRRTRLEAALRDWLIGGAANPLDLFASLADETPCGGREDAPIFIRSPVYGTRCSTVIAIDAGGKGRIIERRFDESGAVMGEGQESFG